MDSISLETSPDLLMCTACGTQFPVSSDKDECRVCDDPRQFVPPEGQTFTTLDQMTRAGYHNVWWQDKHDSRVWSVRTEPSFAVGQRAELIQTARGNILWDLIPYLDQATVDKIVSLGGLKAIVISHPHYYCTWADWARTFSCPVYVGAPDREWLERTNVDGADVCFFNGVYTPIQIDGLNSGAVAIVTGGHFPGSAVLHWEKTLFIADTVVTSPSATNPVPGKDGVISFTFFYSIANRIPLHPDDVLGIWNKVKDLDFDTTIGAFKGMDVYTMSNEKERGTDGVKGRLLESCKIFVKASGWTTHAILDATL